MKIHKEILFFLVIIFTSCSFFSSRKHQEKLKKEEIVNFTEVDVPPSFPSCKNVIEEDKDKCFREEIHKRIASKLTEKKIETAVSVRETIYVNILIDKEGGVHLQNIRIATSNSKAFSQLDSFLRKTVKELPKLFPAIKRGIPVATQYQLPIHLSTSEKNNKEP
ncbi:conserved hypothetical protein [Tenacibaculum maritimum]|uniref:hypothetical protein n=1 Tax=Tenacibaculum maritimum TaxID=107401 RepID=UPI0012E63182|nr:hypothetical protein [Tenacibaculum maritimum]CAA0246237.1 conserved hypothetical protein [Tenacibaculum maritimum]